MLAQLEITDSQRLYNFTVIAVYFTFWCYDFSNMEQKMWEPE